MTDTFFAIPWRQMLLPELSWAEKLVRPLLVYLVLVQEGKVEKEMMRKFDVSDNELLAAIRKQGIIRLCDVAFAILELDGSISVIKTDDDMRPHDCLPFEIAGKESYAAEDAPKVRNKNAA